MDVLWLKRTAIILPYLIGHTAAFITPPGLVPARCTAPLAHDIPRCHMTPCHVLRMAGSDGASDCIDVDRKDDDGQVQASKSFKGKKLSPDEAKGQTQDDKVVVEGNQKDEFALVDRDDLSDFMDIDQARVPQSVFDSAYCKENESVCRAKRPDKRFHLHFGAGRLGLGLVLQAVIDGDSPYALVQRPSKDWKPFYEEGCDARLSFSINGELTAKDVKVVTEACGVDKCANAMVALTEDEKMIHELVSQASSFSTALGPAITKVMEPILKTLEDKPEEDRPILYACENEHEPVEELAKKVKSKVNCVTCMVDRICTGKKVEDHTINVDVEPEFKGSIVVLTPFEDPSVVPFGGNVDVPKDKDVAEYLYKRKFSLVNGGHSMLAFMSLRKENAPAQCDLEDYDLIKPSEASKDLCKEIDAWVKTRIVMLLDEVGIDTMKKYHETDDEKKIFDALLGFSDQVLHRYSTLDDTTERVFGGTRGSRWANRLRPQWKYTQKNTWAGSDTPMGRFIEYAKVDEDYAKKVIADLTESSVKYISDDLKKCAEATKKSFA